MARSSWGTNSDAFERALNSAMAKVQVNSKRELLKLGYQVKNDCVIRTPVKTGKLRADWSVTAGVDEKGDYVEVANGNEVAVLVENGTRPHKIRVRTAAVLTDKKKGEPGGTVWGKEVGHPGTRPQPMLRPALLRARNWKPKGITD